jgi:hypothetical protein
MDGSLEDRMTRLEVMMESLARQLSRELEINGQVNQAMAKAIERLTSITEAQDKRLYSLERSIAWALGAIAVLLFLANIFSPWIRSILSIPS